MCAERTRVVRHRTASSASPLPVRLPPSSRNPIVTLSSGSQSNPKNKTSAMALTAPCCCVQRRSQVAPVPKSGSDNLSCAMPNTPMSLWLPKPVRMHRKRRTEPGSQVSLRNTRYLSRPRTQNCEPGQIRLVTVPRKQMNMKTSVEPSPTKRLFYDAVLRCMQSFFCYNKTVDRKTKEI